MADATGAVRSAMEFVLKYDGTALATGRMSARELGPAILSMADLLERTSEILYRDGSKLRVDVQGNFRKGSFTVDFLAAAVDGNLVANLNLEQLAAIAGVLGFLYAVGKDAATGVVKSVLAVIRWQRGRKIESVDASNRDNVRLIIEDESITVTHNVYLLLKDDRVRDALAGIMEPLQTPGIDFVEIGPPAALQPVRVTKEEAPFFSPSLAPAEELGTEEHTEFVEVVSPEFRDGNKWRFDAGGATWHAEIEDQTFMDSVRRHEVTLGWGMY